MKTISRSILLGNLLATFLLAQPSSSSAASYSVTDLGPVGPAGQPFYVTNNGLVGGASATASGSYHGVFWYRGLQSDVGTFGGSNSTAYGVNVKAEVVGWAETSETDPYGEDFCGFGTHNICLPFVWQSGLMSPLPTLGGKSGTAYMVNSRGQAAGVAETSGWDPTCPAPQKFQFKPVIWTNGAVQELPTSAGDIEGAAFTVNESGQAVGASGACSAFNPISLLNFQPLHALLWENGVVTDLGSLGGTGHAGGISARSINNMGQVVGGSDLRGDQTFHAFLWTKSMGMQDLGTVTGDFASEAIANNDSGDVVGVSLDNQFNPRAFLWRNGVMADLNSLVPAGSPLYLFTACSINSSGDIIGIAISGDGSFHSYMAVPANGTAGGVNSSIVAPDVHAVDALAPVPESARKLLRGLWMRR
jgi:probable HAF family extracellular repeat protein